MNSLLQTLSCADGHDPDALPVGTAQALILAQLAPVPDFERSFVRCGLNRVLGEDVVAPVNVPAHDNSAMDGYALRHAELSAAGETRLAIVGSAYAGRAFEGHLPPGSALRIMTGAIVPEGLDTVVPQETVRVEGEIVIIPPGQRAGQHLRRAGEDLKAGQPALKAGKWLRPAEIGLLASLGQVEVTLRRRLRVAIFSTGDELCSIGTPLAPGQVYDSNRYTLWGMLTRLGCEVRDMGVVRDDPATLEAALAAAAKSSDVIITSGGVSVGEADFVRELMARLGEVAFWKIAMKPGRPMAFGRIGAAWLFGLPGNPVAVMVTFYAFVRPALLHAMGAQQRALPMLRAVSAEPMRKKPGRTEYQRGMLTPLPDGRWQVRAIGNQGSGVLSSMSQADGLIVLHHDQGSAEAGELVDVLLFDGLV